MLFAASCVIRQVTLALSPVAADSCQQLIVAGGVDIVRSSFARHEVFEAACINMLSSIDEECGAGHLCPVLHAIAGAQVGLAEALLTKWVHPDAFWRARQRVWRAEQTCICRWWECSCGVQDAPDLDWRPHACDQLAAPAEHARSTILQSEHQGAASTHITRTSPCWCKDSFRPARATELSCGHSLALCRCTLLGRSLHSAHKAASTSEIASG